MDKTKTERVAEKKVFGFNKNIFFLGTVSLLNDIASEMIYPLLPIFMTSVLGAGVAFVGLVEGIADGSASLFKVFSGWASDRTNNRRPLIIFGYSLSAATKPLIGLVGSPWHLLWIKFLDRVGKGIRTAPRDALLTYSCDVTERGRSFGFHRSMDHAGAIIGPLIAFVLLRLLGVELRTIFLLSIIPGAASVLILFLFIKEKRGIPKMELTTRFKLSSFDRRFKLFLLIVLIFSLGNSSDAFLVLLAKERGIDIFMLPILWILLHISKAASSIPAGILSDKIGRKKMIISGWIVYALVYLGFGFLRDGFIFWGLFACYGLFFGLTEAAERALISDLAPEDLRGTAYGLYHLAVGVSILPASLIMGALWQAFGVEVAFATGAGLALIATILFMLLIRSDL